MAGLQGYNVGRDVTLFLVTPQGTILFPSLQRFTSRQITDKRMSRPLNSSVVFLDIPAGWEGEFEIDRQDPTFDTFFAIQEQQYYAGQGISSSTIQETDVNATDGSTSVFQYVGVVLTYDDAGDRRADDVIKQRVGWRGSQRIQLS
jgi:hypothetical protein